MAQGSCTRVNIDKLIIDARYQRPVDEQRVGRIVNEFDPRKLGALELSKRKNGTFAIIDGQHRFEAMKAVGRKTAPAIVHADLTPKDEAYLFAKINSSRKQPSPIERFRAQVFSGDEKAVAISGAATAAGFRIQEKTDPAVIRAVSSLESVHSALGTEGLAEMLCALRDCWYSVNGCTDSNMIRGMGAFWQQFGDRFEERHVDRLRTRDPLRIVQAARSKAFMSGIDTSRGSSRSLALLVADDIRKTCGLKGNTGIRQSGRPQPAKKQLVEA